MKKTKEKTKTSKKSAAVIQPEQQGLLDLVSAMVKIAERLEVLEQRVEKVVRQNSAGFSEMTTLLQNIQRLGPGHGAPDVRGENKSSYVVHGDQQNIVRHERMMYKAVCADCRMECEVPFKPTGERPVYCKDCFSKRKLERSSSQNCIEPSAPLILEKPEKDSSKKKSQKAGKKAKKS